MTKLFRKWVINCSLGELIGIGLAGSIAVVLNNMMGEPQTIVQKLLVLLLMLAAGTLEGTAIAFSQWRVLHILIPALRFINWWKWTVCVALLGWALGMLPSLFFSAPANDGRAVPGLLFFALLVAAGSAAGALFGWFQSFELRKHVNDWLWWIVANALAWMVAMLVIFYGATWPDETTPAAFIVASAVISGCLAGCSLGIITGLFLFGKIFHNESREAHHGRSSFS